MDAVDLNNSGLLMNLCYSPQYYSTVTGTLTSKAMRLERTWTWCDNEDPSGDLYKSRGKS
jgi:hypothetical protein